MRTFFLLFFIGLTNLSIACSCMQPTFSEKYFYSDFVARVKIEKVYFNANEDLFYKSDIKILKLFKGNSVNSILIFGNSDGRRRTSCDIFFPVGTELLVYASVNKLGSYEFDSCSGYVVIDSKYAKPQGRELAVLDFLQSKNIRRTEKIRYDTRVNKALEKFRGVRLEQSYALYEVTFASDMSVKSVKTVTGFNADLDQQLSDILKNARWGSSIVNTEYNVIRNQVPEDSKYIFGIYYYDPEGGYESFLSNYDL